MTPDERELLKRFLNDLGATQGAVKDPEADRMITAAVSGNPDAPYVLVQHAILSDRAIRAAQARIAELEQQLSQSSPQRSDSSFLGGGSPWTRGRGQGPSQSPGQHDEGGLFSGNSGPNSSGLGNFLRNAGTTAAGVAGGAFLFQGLSNLFGHGGFGGWGDHVTINEFYGDAGGSSDSGGFFDSDSDGGGDFGGGDFDGDV